MRPAYSLSKAGNRGMHQQPGRQELQEVVPHWNQIWNTARPVLRVYREGRRLRIVDTRPCSAERLDCGKIGIRYLSSLRLRANGPIDREAAIHGARNGGLDAGR